MKRICFFLAGLLWERQFEKILLKYRLENVLRDKTLFWSVYVDDIKFSRHKQNIDPIGPMREILNKEVALENKHLSFKDNAKRQKCCRQLQSHV